MSAEKNEIEEEILDGATYPEIIDSINSKADKINVNLNISNETFIVDQIDPWNIRINVQAYLTMEDNAGLAKWQRWQNITAFVPITGFEDPIF